MAALQQQEAPSRLSLEIEKFWETFRARNERVDREMVESQREMAEIRAAFRETDRIVKETAESLKETDRIVKETAAQQKETDRIVKETTAQQRETDRIVKEVTAQQRETDRIVKETAESLKKTDRLLKKVTKNLGGLGGSLGELVETLIAARLWEKFSAYPYGFSSACRRLAVLGESGKELTDIDILLVGGEWAMAVEVKVNADRRAEVDRHLKRMELIRKHPPPEAAGKKLLGAIAAGAVTEDVRSLAHASGFFVLELKGEAVALAPPPEGFAPGEW